MDLRELLRWIVCIGRLDFRELLYALVKPGGSLNVTDIQFVIGG